VDEVPTRVTLAVQMETPGLVVLADRWDKGWHAYLNGQEVPILHANHAIRGVVVSAGAGTLEFRYEPASFMWGLGLSGLGALILLAWLAAAWRAGAGHRDEPVQSAEAAKQPPGRGGLSNPKKKRGGRIRRKP
jgi:uncharacterized membrane protein YfhO